MFTRTEKLPGGFEDRYNSENLKDQIADEGMWGLIPAVTYSMSSPEGVKRLERNHILFSFIDEWFGDEPFAFEPNMRNALKDADPATRRNGEGLVEFIQGMMK